MFKNIFLVFKFSFWSELDDGGFGFVCGGWELATGGRELVEGGWELANGGRELDGGGCEVGDVCLEDKVLISFCICPTEDLN